MLLAGVTVAEYLDVAAIWELEDPEIRFGVHQPEPENVLVEVRQLPGALGARAAPTKPCNRYTCQYQHYPGGTASSRIRSCRGQDVADRHGRRLTLAHTISRKPPLHAALTSSEAVTVRQGRKSSQRNPAALRLWPDGDSLQRHVSLQERLLGQVLDELNETFDAQQTQRPTAANLPQCAAIVRHVNWVAPVAEQIAEPLHVGQVVLEAPTLQVGPLRPTSGPRRLLSSAPLPESCLKSCSWPLQVKLSLNLVEIERQRAAIRPFCILGELREETFERRVGQQESAISETRVDPAARAINSMDVDDVARNAEANGEFVPPRIEQLPSVKT